MFLDTAFHYCFFFPRKKWLVRCEWNPLRGPDFLWNEARKFKTSKHNFRFHFRRTCQNSPPYYGLSFPRKCKSNSLVYLVRLTVVPLAYRHTQDRLCFHQHWAFVRDVLNRRRFAPLLYFAKIQTSLYHFYFADYYASSSASYLYGSSQLPWTQLRADSECKCGIDLHSACKIGNSFAENKLQYQYCLIISVVKSLFRLREIVSVPVQTMRKMFLFDGSELDNLEWLWDTVYVTIVCLL